MNPATEEPLARAGASSTRPPGRPRVRAHDGAGPRCVRSPSRSAARCSRPCATPSRPPRRAPRPLGHERRQHAQRRQVRRGRRHRSRCPPTPRSARSWAPCASSPTGRACTLGRTPPLPRPAHRGAAPGRRRPHQRLQLPGLGPRGEGGGGAPRGHARRSSSPPRSSCLLAHRIVEILVEKSGAARGRALAARGRSGRPPRARGAPGRGGVHRLGRTRRRSIRALSSVDPPQRARQRGGRQPERGRARPRRGAGRRDLRPLPEGRAARHDPEGRPEVHGHPPRPRSRRRRRARARGPRASVSRR